MKTATIRRHSDDLTPNHIVYGMAGGFAASIVLALIILLKVAAQYHSEYNVLDVQANAFHYGNNMAAGWLIHFIIGTFVWGVIYALVNKSLGVSPIEKGITFGVLIWLLAMLVIMPMSQAGYFATEYGTAALTISFALHIIFGITQAYTYAQFDKEVNPTRNQNINL